MGGFIVIIPVLAFDVWLVLTVGRRQFRIWKAARRWRDPALAAGAGVILAIALTFFVTYRWDQQTRARGFPIPTSLSTLKDGVWGAFVPPPALPLYVCGLAVNFITGLAAPLIPFKVAEFLRAVKAEL